VAASAADAEPRLHAAHIAPTVGWEAPIGAAERDGASELALKYRRLGTGP
jgi:hypothetical protein